MKYTVLLFSLLFVCNLSAQEYKTYKKINDSTYVETRSLEEEESLQLSEDAVLSAFFREMDRWANIKNRHYNNMIASQRVFAALNRDQRVLIADTTYLQYNIFRDTIYSYPELKRDESNAIIYDSRLTVGDSTYNVQLFRNAANNQLVRIESTASSHAARFIEADKLIRLGNSLTPLPGLTDFVDLNLISENNIFRVYFARVQGSPVVLRIRKR